MPQPLSVFQDFPYITPIACPHCGGKAALSQRLPDPLHPRSEIRTFDCEQCGKQSEMRLE